MMHAVQYLDAERLANGHHCKTHPDLQLVVLWDFNTASFAVLCRECRALGNSPAYEKRLSARDMWREDPDSVPLAMANQFERIERRRHRTNTTE